ncbi:PaaI family thioesterase [Paraferrimonas sedimenticola]|uniref:Thioesterase n=1 Tax=Paraferrimonas sedimenticola TaxID=375674 RepID=A0AA37RW48_9GAMM|nr:PaaI family thioesterase [Paraferrimonas sedimenticola]GLP96450.1 thioesterase [Paraferrimonas sedimenticola]
MSDTNYLGLATAFVDQLTHCHFLGLNVKDAGPDFVELCLPYNPELVGYPETGVLHGGSITTLMDTASGASVVCASYNRDQQLELSPTLDLRVDYMKSARPNEPVYGRVTCYKITHNIAFVRGVAYQDDPQDAIAHVVGSFMRIGPDVLTEDFRNVLQEGLDGVRG